MHQPARNRTVNPPVDGAGAPEAAGTDLPILKETSMRTIPGTDRPRVIAVALALTGLASFPVAPSRASVVSDWSAVAAATVNAPPGTYPAVTPEEQRANFALDLPTVHVAMYDAAVAVQGRYRPFATTVTAPAGASVEAAVGAATCRVLGTLFPNRAPVYGAACASFRPGAAGSAADAAGIAAGVAAADGAIALRANDGRLTNVPYVPTGAAGEFTPFPAGSTPANTFLPYVRPFAMASAAQFRADGPPALGSAQYAEDFAQVAALGAAGSTVRTAEQEEIARFHTEPPPAFVARNLRRFYTPERDVVENARLAAMLYVGLADATIGCFESKYVYRFWRPRAAIPAAGDDGNAATTADAGWLPVVPTPNHPEYPAAHACTYGAVAQSLRDYFGTKKIDFYFDSTVTGTSHAFDSTDDMAKETQYARIYGGMHFRTSTVHGTVLGRRTAAWVDKHHFQPVAGQ